MAFRFLDLAAELRNRIYHLAAIDDEPMHPYGRRYGTYLGLTRVCHQIRKEYLPIQRRAASIAFIWRTARVVSECLATLYCGADTGPRKLIIMLESGNEFFGANIPLLLALPMPSPSVTIRSPLQDDFMRKMLRYGIEAEVKFVQEEKMALVQFLKDGHPALVESIENGNDRYEGVCLLGHYGLPLAQLFCSPGWRMPGN
ncbi:hypothetical protein BDW02DRAFT_645173 [Decorospora gaudefroyi]|uniref:Uncharacterized protein n=1 Tax=Decorospora gaudefroyi TaxID=184978 RepID=A0A6A5KNV0_9PLEO|nr:hypothetical protein BDW02DRAFT_645173 [Decorospora gaudefroyi]